MVKKGISPLIAAVLLIFITMIIAGIMATWATSFVKTETGKLECIGALAVEDLEFSSGTVTVKIKNTDDAVELSGLRVYIEYSDATKNKDYVASGYGVSDPLMPAAVDWFTVNTGDSTTPEKIEVVALSCPKSPASANF